MVPTGGPSEVGDAQENWTEAANFTVDTVYTYTYEMTAETYTATDASSFETKLAAMRAATANFYYGFKPPDVDGVWQTIALEDVTPEPTPVEEENTGDSTTGGDGDGDGDGDMDDDQCDVPDSDDDDGATAIMGVAAAAATLATLV